MKPAATTDAVVVLHESRELLPDLVRGLRAQSEPFASWCFCLNGRDDGSADYLRALPEAPRLVERLDNPGFAGGANAALALGEAPFALLLNPDVELGEDYLARTRAALGADAGLGAAGGLLWREDAERGPIVDSAGFHRQPWWRIVDRDAGEPLSSWAGKDEDRPGLCGAALLLKREALRAIAPDGRVLDERYWMYKEDQDLALRLQEAGFRSRFVAGARAKHDRGWRPGGRSGIGLRLRRHSLKNRYLLLARHFRLARDWPSLPAILLFEMVQATVLLLSEPKTVLGYAWAWRTLRGRPIESRVNGGSEG